MANKDIINAILRGNYNPGQLTYAAPQVNADLINKPGKLGTGNKATGNPWESNTNNPWSPTNTGDPWTGNTGNPLIGTQSEQPEISDPTGGFPAISGPLIGPPKETDSPDEPSGLDKGNVADWEQWSQDRLDKWLAASDSRMSGFRGEIDPILQQLSGVTEQYQKMAAEGLLNVDDLVDQIKSNLSGDAANITKNAAAGFRQQHAGRIGPYSQLVDTTVQNKVLAPLQAQIASTVGKSKIDLTKTNEQYKIIGMEGTQAALAQQNRIQFALENMENSERARYETIAENYTQFLLQLDQSKELTEAGLYQAWQMFQQQMDFNERHAYDNQPSGGGFFDIMGGVVDIISKASSFVPGPWQAPSLVYQGANV